MRIMCEFIYFPIYKKKKEKEVLTSYFYVVLSLCFFKLATPPARP